MRIISLLTIAALSLSLSGVAHADKKEDASVSEKSFREYRECLRTPPVRFHGTIVEAALATPELSTLAFAVQAAGLVDVLNSDGPFTVFAPLDTAFAAIPPAILSAITADADLLGAVLTYHVLAGDGRRQDPRRVIFSREKRSVLGQTVFFNRSSEGPQVNQSNVSCQGVKTDNGMVWLIDSVLLPQF